MDAANILRRLFAAGVRLELKGDLLSASPASRMNDELRGLIRTNKPALLAYLADAHQTTSELVEAAMRACDTWQDGPAAREAMRRDCVATPPHLRADLLAHFREVYGGSLGGSDTGPAAGKHPCGP